MSPEKDVHLDEDQLLRALVDEGDLPAPLREHLSLCPVCRAEMERFEKTLARLGETAEHLTPSPIRRVSLPAEAASSRGWWSWGWRGALATAVSIAVVILVISWSLLVKETPESGVAMVSSETWQDMELMIEIRRLEENPLSEVYLDISVGSYLGFDEGFMEFVVPPIETDTLSRDWGRGGGLKC